MVAGARSPSWLRCVRDRIDAPCVVDGPINGESFLAYVEQVLVPTLQAGRYRHHRQSRQSQRQSRTPCHPSCRGQAVLPAALQPRSQSDRAGLRQAQDAAAQGRRAHRRSHLATDWCAARLPSRHRNAPTISETLAMLRLKLKPLDRDQRSRAVCLMPKPANRNQPARLTVVTTSSDASRSGATHTHKRTDGPSRGGPNRDRGPIGGSHNPSGGSPIHGNPIRRASLGSTRLCQRC